MITSWLLPASELFSHMNSIILIKELIGYKNDVELDQYLSGVWDKVWKDKSKLNYANLRLFKTIDKIKTISEIGVDFKGKYVLDIGCGNGTTLLYLRKFFDIKGVGIDISEEVVGNLKSNISDPELLFDIGDHRNLAKIESNTFDLVLSFGVIEHLDEYGLALVEARRVLRPGGQLVLIQPHLLSFGVLQKYYLQLADKWRFGKQKDFSCFHYRSLLLQTGFRNIQFSTRLPYPDMNICRMVDSFFKTIMPFWGHYLYLVAQK